MGSLWYDRQGTPIDAATANTLLGRPGYKRIELTAVGGAEISTVWLGDLSGWEVSGTAAGQVALHHRCGHAETLRASGIRADFSVYVGNVVEHVLEVVEAHTCKPYEPSPEHQARVARWQSTTDVKGPDDIPERLDAQERVSGPPVQRPGLLYSDAPGLATPQHRMVDGPGCTPAVVDVARVECLGDGCTGCSDPQCWTARADGGDV